MNKILEDFHTTVDMVYGIYLDSIAGYTEAYKRLRQTQRDMIKHFEERGEIITIQELDEREFYYGDGNFDINAPNFNILHHSSQGEFNKRNSQGGLNYKNIGNMCLVLIYQYWEDYYRKELGKFLGIDSNEIQIEILGDIRLLRKSIIHHQGIALNDVEKCTIIKWFKENDEIFFSKEQFNELINQIYLGIQQYSKQFLS